MNTPAVQLDVQPNEAGDVRIGRLVMVMTAVAFPVWWWVLRATYPWAKDPLAPRLLISGLALSVAVASMSSERRAREVPGWMALVCALASMVAIWLAWSNAALPAYIGQVMATVGMSALAVRRLTGSRSSRARPRRSAGACSASTRPSPTTYRSWRPRAQ